jgi:integrase/recombinase XerD
MSAVWLYTKDERPEPAEMDSKHLFLTVNGYPFTRHTLRGVILRLAQKVGIHATPHMFRHTAAILHLKNGMDLVSLQHLLGHNDISTTRGYLEALKDEDVEDKARRTSPSDNWRL